MRAVVYERFGGELTLRDVEAPTPGADDALVRVEATGLCRSDWHGWLGHDPDIELPQVPGHEFAGVVAEVGGQVRSWTPGYRVTAPFVCGCGRCRQCLRGDHQVCEAQSQPGFTHAGSFAEYVLVRHADVNLVGLPDTVDAVTAASLGCRYATAWRAVTQQGRAAPGEWVAVHGCGGVGLSAVQIATASGARVIAVDVSDAALALAGELGAEACIDATDVDVVEAVHEVTGGGAHLSLDALGSPQTCVNSVRCLARRGRHVQVGLLPPETGRPEVPMDVVIARELELRGSHGMAAHAYPELLALVTSGRLRPDALVRARIGLENACAALPAMGEGGAAGMTIVDRF